MLYRAFRKYAAVKSETNENKWKCSAAPHIRTCFILSRSSSRLNSPRAVMRRLSRYIIVRVLVSAFKIFGNRFRSSRWHCNKSSSFWALIRFIWSSSWPHQHRGISNYPRWAVLHWVWWWHGALLQKLCLSLLTKLTSDICSYKVHFNGLCVFIIYY